MRLPRLLAREPSELIEPRLDEELNELIDKLSTERETHRVNKATNVFSHCTHVLPFFNFLRSVHDIVHFSFFICMKSLVLFTFTFLMEFLQAE